MTILEQVSEMKNQGISEEEIIKKLQDLGASPKAINDALDQEKIKKAVSNEEEYGMPSSQTPKMQRSVNNQEIPNDQMYYPQQEEEYSPQDYSQYQENSTYTQGFDTNTIIEISEQVFSEKIQKIQKLVDECSEFKTLTETKIENISLRVKRIESISDKLQTAILEKIGSYGSNLESIKKEMSMMQDSFGKMINPLAERAEEKHHKHLHKTIAHAKKVKRKTSKRK